MGEPIYEITDPPAAPGAQMVIMNDPTRQLAQGLSITEFKTIMKPIMEQAPEAKGINPSSYLAGRVWQHVLRKAHVASEKPWEPLKAKGPDRRREWARPPCRRWIQDSRESIFAVAVRPPQN